MNKNFTTVLMAATIALVSGCVTAGTWINGSYINGPVCTACDGIKFVAHAYGTTVCAHCDGTGIEPPENTIVMENVVVDTWCPMPPPPPTRWHRPRTICRPHPPRHHGGGHHKASPTARSARGSGGRPRQTVHRAGGGKSKTVRAGAPRGGGGKRGRAHGR